MKTKTELVISLDLSDFEKVKKIVSAIDVETYKIGPVPFSAFGNKILEYLSDKKIFLDFKFFDIPSVISKAIKNFSKYPLKYITVHTRSGEETIKQAKESAGETKVLGVTILTSERADRKVETILQMCKTAKQGGADGVVCPADCAMFVKEKFPELLITTPGVRLEEDKAKTNDHISSETPYNAVRNGADIIVIGRPILEAENPRETLKKIREDIERAEKEKGRI